MNEASENLDFESALEYRNIILDLEAIGERQKMETGLDNSDIFNYAVKEDYINIQVFHVRETKVIERNAFTFDLMNEPIETFASFINQFYLLNNNPLPREIIVPKEVLEKEYVELLDEKILKVAFAPKQGKKKELLDLVLVNINKELDNLILKKQRTYEMTMGAAIELAKLLQIEKANNIEAFDNSNIQGVSSISAMVKYINGEKSTKDYRKYKVKNVVGSDDANTFYEIITRRYKRLKEENEVMPDLIIMDGGKPQVNAALEALKDIEVSIPIMGLVKDDSHRTNAILYNNEIIELNKRSPLFKFLTNIQDEVHRYAISFHHNTHAKNILSSKLDAIKGIGKVRKAEILKALGEVDFKERLDKLKLSEEQKEEILKIYNLN